MNAEPQATSNADEKKLDITCSRQFAGWLAEQKTSLAFTTYQAGKIFFIGTKADKTLSIFERTFNRCMGLCPTEHGFYMSTLYQLWRFEEALHDTPQNQQGQYDSVYIPQIAYTTGDLDIHDIILDKDKKPVFVNTRFSCLATLSETHSFVPYWQPPFISKLAPEDRCHLNGLTSRDGEPRYVTSVSKSDVHEGWRDNRTNGGFVMDITDNTTICDGLSMPHSPRFHQGNIWLHNSGNGQFGFIDMKTGKFEEVCFCPGYLRGMTFINNYAVIGLSKARNDRAFGGLPMHEKMTEQNIQPRCGLRVVDLDKGSIVHSLDIDGIVEEIYDIITLPKGLCPMAIGTVSDDIQRSITIGGKEVDLPPELPPPTTHTLTIN